MYHTVIERVSDPIEKGDRREEVILLAKLIELGIPVKHASRDELIEDSNDEGRENSEDDVVV